LIRGKKLQGWLYILPWIIGFLTFKIYPLIASIFYSFTNYGQSRRLRIVGWQNYINFFIRDIDFTESVIATAKYVFIGVPFKLLFALFVASILSKTMKGINLYRTIYYIPSILSGSLPMCILWRLLWRGDGIINAYLGKLGIQQIEWLTSPDLAIYSLCLLMAYGFGSSMVIFLAGLKQIPSEMVEAANIDGAGKIRIYLKIKLPLLTPMIFFNAVMQIVFAFQHLTDPFVITKGGPANSTLVMILKLYNEAFINMRMGYASAISVIIFVFVGLISLLLFKSQKYWVHYME
jgi:oligogalacturonide transport system permease protein